MLEGKITNVPHIPRKKAFLDSGDMVKNPVHVFEKYRAELGPTFTFHFGGSRKTIVSANPVFIQHVLKDNARNYEKSDIQVKRMAEFQGKGLLNSHGDFWFRQRRLLSHGFNRTHLTTLLPLQAQVLEEFMVGFNKEASQGPVDIYHHMVNLTLRLVGKSLFGNQMLDRELDQIGEAISEIQAFMVKQIVQPYKIQWFRISGQTSHFQKIRYAADQIIFEYVTKRKQNSSENNDILQLMLNTPYKDTNEVMSEEQVMIEVLQLLVAGNETSSNTLSWAFYLLARHPEHIEAIREEVETTFGDREIDFSGLHQLNYSIRVLDEVMRLYPPFWMIDRIALRDDQIDGIQIPEGITVVPYIYGVHHDASIWENPNSFDPSRFTQEQIRNRHSFSHIPFGGGPRVCIGQNMALMQMLLIIVTIIRKYDFKMSDDQKVDINPMMILRPNGAIAMKFTSAGKS